METRRLILVLGGIAVVLVVVLGGLSLALLSSGGSGGSDDNGTPAAETSPLPERVAGELRLAGPDPLTLDPACAADTGSAEYIVEIFSGLVAFDRDLNLIPDIAEKWDVSDDGTVYTFHIRRGVKFHDGSRQGTADDFKFSMERSLDPDTLFTDGKGYFLAKLTYPTAFVVDRREVGDSSCFSNTEWTRNPNGTGPFVLAEWQLAQRIVLTPNADYYLEPKPSLARVTYVLAGGSPLVMYENDEIDITGVGINDIERIRDSSEPLNAEFTESPSLDTYYIGFNTEEPPFDDPEVRRAFAMAIDKQVLSEVVLKNLVTPANGVLPPGMPAFNDALEGIPFDADGAKALLEDAGGGGSLGKISLLSSGRGASVGPIIEAIQAMWEQNLGVTVEVDQEEFGLFLRDLDDGNFKMFDLGWVADYVDPQNFLDIKFHSQSPNNEMKYSNPDVDSLLEEARTEQDEPTRLDLYRQAEEMIVEDAPWIPLYHGKSKAPPKPYVKDYFIPPFVIPNLRYVSVTR